MQKMKTGLMMFCLTVLLSCAALMMNAPTASAMSLADLQGDYKCTKQGNNTCYPQFGKPLERCIITFTYENDEYYGVVTRTKHDGPAQGKDIIKDGHVENGTVHCWIWASKFPGDGYGTMRVNSDGTILTFYDSNGKFCYEMQKV